MNFSREMRSDQEGLEGPERFDRICELFIATVLWLLLLGLATHTAMRIEIQPEMHGPRNEARPHDAAVRAEQQKQKRQLLSQAEIEPGAKRACGLRP